MSDSEIEIVLRHLRVVRFEPGDTLVLRFPVALSVKCIHRIHESTRAHLPPDVRVLVIGDGGELSVLRGIQEHPRTVLGPAVEGGISLDDARAAARVLRERRT